MEVTDYNPSPIAPFHLDTQPVLPTTYEDSLSFYECLAQLTDKLNLLIDEVNTHEVDIEQLKEEFNSLDEQVKKLQKEMLEAQANIEKLLPLIEKMTEVEGKIAALEKRVKTNEDNIGQLQTDMTQAQEDIETNAGGIAKNKSDIEGLRTDLTTAQEDLDAAEGEIDALQEDMTQAQADIGDLQGRVTANEGNITDLQGRVTANEGDIDGLNDRVTANEGDITDLKGRVTTNEGDIADLKGRVAAAEGTLSDTAAKAEKNAGDIAALQESVTSAQGDITALQEDMTQAQTDIQTNADGVAQNKADIAALKAGMGENTGVDFSSLTGLSNVSTGGSLETGGVTVTSTADAPDMAGVTVTSRGELNTSEAGDFHFNAKLHLPIVASETVDVATVNSGTYAALNYKGQADVDKLKEDVAGIKTETIDNITSISTKALTSSWNADAVGKSDTGVSITASGEITYGEKTQPVTTVVSLPIVSTNTIEAAVYEPTSGGASTGKSIGFNFRNQSDLASLLSWKTSHTTQYENLLRAFNQRIKIINRLIKDDNVSYAESTVTTNVPNACSLFIPHEGVVTLLMTMSCDTSKTGVTHTTGTFGGFTHKYVFAPIDLSFIPQVDAYINNTNDTTLRVARIQASIITDDPSEWGPINAQINQPMLDATQSGVSQVYKPAFIIYACNVVSYFRVTIQIMKWCYTDTNYEYD